MTLPMQPDALDGFRTNPMLLARALSDPKVEKDALYHAMYVGDCALRVMTGVASREDAVTLVANLIAHCEVDVQRNLKALLECHDLTDKRAEEAHFDARVSAAILTRLNQFIRDGSGAAMELKSQQEMEP